MVLNRTVFLRFAPEMQGQWNSYGQQPSKFLATFIAVHDGIKAIAPATIMVWAPNTPQGYVDVELVALSSREVIEC